MPPARCGNRVRGSRCLIGRFHLRTSWSSRHDQVHRRWTSPSATPLSSRDWSARCPPGTYRVDVEEEPIDGLSFLAYRRLATFMAGYHGRTRRHHFENLLIDPKELDRALERNSAARGGSAR